MEDRIGTYVYLKELAEASGIARHTLLARERRLGIDVPRPDPYGTRGWRRSRSSMDGATSGASSGDGR